MNEGQVERLDGGGGSVDLVLQRLHRPVWLLPHPNMFVSLHVLYLIGPNLG